MPEDDALFALEDLSSPLSLFTAAELATPTVPESTDAGVAAVVAAFRAVDPDGSRAAAVFRATFDQLYDGQHTGRYHWEQLYKTEKTHFGTLIEINLRREFTDIVGDGTVLDYQVAGLEVDCKYSQRMGGWMLPPEVFDHLVLACTASDADGTWSMGVVRASEQYRRTTVNRDGKSTLSPPGVAAVVWLHHQAELPPNVLLRIDPAVTEGIFGLPTGQQRVIELFRKVTNRRIGRNTVATVAQQDDYMKRVRANGGARSALKNEGYLIAGGDYAAHRHLFGQLGAEVPQPGEFVSVRVLPATEDDARCVAVDGALWRLAQPGEATTAAAPELPSTVAARR